MQDLQFSLIVLGGFAILGVLVHGLWTIRKNSQQAKAESRSQLQEPEVSSSQPEPDPDPEVSSEPVFSEPELGELETELDEVTRVEQESINIQGADTQVEQAYDELGIGEVRIVDIAPTQPESLVERDVAAVIEEAESEVQMPEPPSSLLKEDVEGPESAPAVEKKKKPRVDMYPSPVTHSKIEGAAPMQEPVLGKSEISEAKIAAPKGARKEPKLDEEQMSINFDDDIRMESEPVVQPRHDKPKAALEPEVLVLNVKSPEDKPIPGSALLPMLLTLGFKFGDQDIFHRHVNSNGKGPVLFSMANMFKPGNFDIDNLENFSTQGVSLFMMLPIEGDPHQVFNMMHNAARKIADEFGGQVLDARRSLLTRQSLQQYVEKIREFERQRMLRK